MIGANWKAHFERAEVERQRLEDRVAELEAAMGQILSAFPADEDAPGDDYAFAVGRIGSIVRRATASVGEAGSTERFERAKATWKDVTGEDVSHLRRPSEATHKQGSSDCQVCGKPGGPDCGWHPRTNDASPKQGGSGDKQGGCPETARTDSARLDWLDKDHDAISRVLHALLQPEAKPVREAIDEDMAMVASWTTETGGTVAPCALPCADGSSCLQPTGHEGPCSGTGPPCGQRYHDGSCILGKNHDGSCVVPKRSTER